MAADTVRTRIYGGGSKGDAIGDFTSDAAQARAAGWVPLGQEWRDGPLGRVLVVTYAPGGAGPSDWGPPTAWGYAPLPDGGPPRGWAEYPGAPGVWPPLPAGWTYAVPVPPPSRLRWVARGLGIAGLVIAAAGLAMASEHRVRTDSQYMFSVGVFALGLAMLSASPALAGVARRKARQPLGWLGRMPMIAIFSLLAAFWALGASAGLAGPRRYDTDTRNLREPPPAVVSPAARPDGEGFTVRVPGSLPSDVSS